MAIAFDSASGRQTGSASSATLAHTCGGADRALVVAVSPVGSGRTVTGVTYNGVAMTQVVTGLTPTVATRSYLFLLLNPDSGTHNIVASFSSSGAYGISGASYTGVKQTSQPDGGPTTVSENATGTRLATVSVTASNCWLIGGGLVTEDVSISSVSGGVLRTSVAQMDVIDSNGVVGTGNQTIGYVWPSTDRHVFFAFSLAPSEVSSPSASISLSPSLSPSISVSLSPSASQSPSSSVSLSPSRSPSLSPSPSSSVSLSPSRSPSSSASPSSSISLSPSVSVSLSPSRSPSASASPSSSISLSPSRSPSASVSPSSSASLSESRSPSLSPSPSSSVSLSPSVSESRSPSISESSSPSATESSSPSLSPSPSSSVSLSPSASESRSPSSSESPSPSAGYEDYTRGNYVVLPTDDADLETNFSSQDYIDVSTDDSVRVEQLGSSEYMLFQFRNFVSDSVSCQVHWNGQSDLPPNVSTVYLQIYNQNTNEWETVDSDSSSSVNTDFDLYADILDLTNYRDALNVITCRVYQGAT